MCCDGNLMKTDTSINFDTDLSIKFLKKLTEYDIENSNLLSWRSI